MTENSLDIVCEFTDSFKTAVAQNDLKTAAECLRDGINPDIRKPGRLSPLMVAVKNASIEMVRLLVDYGVNIDARSSSGSALIMAIKRQHLSNVYQEIIDMLLLLIPRLSIEDRYGHNAIYYAIKYSHDEVIDKLIRADACSITDSSGLSPIYYALQYGNTELAGKLFLYDPLPVKTGEVLTWLLDNAPEHSDAMIFASIFCESFPSKHMAYDYVMHLIDHKAMTISDLHTDLLQFFLLHSDLYSYPDKNNHLFDWVIDYYLNEEAIAVLLNAGMVPTDDGLKKLISKNNPRILSWLNPSYQIIRSLLIEGKIEHFYQKLSENPEILELDFTGTRALFGNRYDDAISYFKINTQLQAEVFLNEYKNNQIDIDIHQQHLDELKTILTDLWDIPLENCSNLMLDAVYLRNYDALERIMELSHEDNLGEYFLQAFEVAFERNDTHVFDILMKSTAAISRITDLFDIALKKEKSDFLVQLFPLLPKTAEIDILKYLDIAANSKNFTMTEQVIKSDKLGEVTEEDAFFEFVLTVSFDTSMVEYLFKRYPKFNYPFVRTMVLADALSESNYDTADFIINMGTKPNMLYHNLKHMIDNGNIELLKKYIRNGLWYCREEFDQVPASVYALQKGQIEMSRLFSYTEKNAKQFIMAVRTNETSKVEEFLKNGFMLNNDLEARIHLNQLVEKNQRYMIALLFEYGFDTRGYIHVLINAIKRKDARLVHKLLENGAGTRPGVPEENSLLHIAFLNNDIETMKALLQADFMLIEDEDEYGDSLLHLSIRNENMNMVKFLLEAGADANHPNKDGKLPLYIAMKSFQLEIAKLLSEFGGKMSL